MITQTNRGGATRLALAAVIFAAAATTVRAQPQQLDPNATLPPQAGFGPNAAPPPGAGAAAPQPLAAAGLNCADFVRNDDGTWSSTHPVQIHNGGVTITIWPTTHFRSPLRLGGLDVGSLLDQGCGGK